MFHCLQVSEDDIIPGFKGLIQYGGNMLPGKVITSNKRKKQLILSSMMYLVSKQEDKL